MFDRYSLKLPVILGYKFTSLRYCRYA